MSKSKSKNKSDSENSGGSVTRPSSTAELNDYFYQLNNATGGNLARFSQGGMSPEVNYQQLTPQQLRAMGGAGATRELGAQRVRDDTLGRVQADPRLSVYQSQYAGQQADRDYWSNLDAILKESEAGMTALAGQQRTQDLNAQQFNAGLTREDLEALARIYFGGKGQYADSWNRGTGIGNSSGSSFGINLSF